MASQDFAFVNSDGLRFVVVCGQKVSASMANLSESQTERLKARYGNQFIWFRKGQRNYVITDRSLISEVLSFFAPMRDLGQQQMPEKLQEELSPRQSSVAASKVPSISAKLNAIQRYLTDLIAKSSPVSRDELAAVQTELNALQAELTQASFSSAEERAALAMQRAILSSRQADIGRQAYSVARERTLMSREASVRTRALIYEAERLGKIVPVHQLFIYLHKMVSDEFATESPRKFDKHCDHCCMRPSDRTFHCP